MIIVIKIMHFQVFILEIDHKTHIRKYQVSKFKNDQNILYYYWSYRFNIDRK